MPAVNTCHVHYLKFVTDWEVHAPHMKRPQWGL
jgi:hypothetical protein